MATRRGNVLDPELTKLVQQVVRQFLNSFQPRPKAQKKRRGGGGGGSTAIQKARVTTAITAATDELAENWGTGEVKFMDDSTGILDSSTTEVDNDNIDMTFAEDAQVIVDTSYSPPRVLTGTCGAVEWSE